MIDIIMIIAVLFVIFLAAVFAGSETGMYQLNILKLRLAVHSKKLSYVMLEKIMKDKPALLITTLLATNLTHYIITSMVTILFIRNLDSGNYAELYTTLVTAPVLFIFAELIPKNIFIFYADYLMPKLSFLLLIIKNIFTYTGFIPLLKAISKFFARLSSSSKLTGTTITKAHMPYINALIHDTKHLELLSPIQIGLINRMANIGQVYIRNVMTSLKKIRSINVNTNKSELTLLLQSTDNTRLAVYEKTHGNIVGYINIYQCLNSEADFQSLRPFLKKFHTLNLNTPVTEAIEYFQLNNCKIVLVTTKDSPSRPIGIVTMKDLAEEILGEIQQW